ncbi:hypothetical protein [Candidatus Thiosymbion oneisti]|uniref:hypothetical protein n=1 Tax=Candidatus Thiosymbion oneisti TaxID=589554 RepID=UPI000AC5173D|nr:hypothetical protein [Candidatus Thiosymbion oneisti]
MSKQVVFTMKLEPELRDTFMAEAAADDQPAAQVMRELMRDYIEQRRQVREYDAYLHRKVNDIQRLFAEEQKEKLLQALQNLQIIKTTIEQPPTKQSKWAEITKRVENDSVHLEGYSEQLKRDMKDFRDNFEFDHD